MLNSILAGTPGIVRCPLSGRSDQLRTQCSCGAPARCCISQAHTHGKKTAPCGWRRFRARMRHTLPRGLGAHVSLVGSDGSTQCHPGRRVWTPRSDRQGSRRTFQRRRQTTSLPDTLSTDPALAEGRTHMRAQHGLPRTHDTRRSLLWTIGQAYTEHSLLRCALARPSPRNAAASLKALYPKGKQRRARIGLCSRSHH